MNKQQPISIIIPMLNEEDNVEPLINEIYTTLNSQIQFEVIVVDDGSKDTTYSRLKKLQETLPNLSIIRHPQNKGQSVALVTGIRQARFEWIVTLDGDGQNDPSDILNLLAVCQQHLLQGKSVVILGNRRRRQDTWVRRVSSKIANKIRNFLLNDECPDTGCSLKMFSKQLFLELPHFNHLHRFLPSLFKRQGATIVNIPVHHRERMKGKSKYGLHNRLWVGIIDLFGVMWLMKRPCQTETGRELNE